ncbi:hypothetical protein BC829DRAFT_398940 [Chytridium lagenaria]|nr:hypothetical protein BC829DRAFT_398940 [Chytridium lagenaria]
MHSSGPSRTSSSVLKQLPGAATAAAAAGGLASSSAPKSRSSLSTGTSTLSSSTSPAFVSRRPSGPQPTLHASHSSSDLSLKPSHLLHLRGGAPRPSPYSESVFSLPPSSASSFSSTTSLYASSQKPRPAPTSSSSSSTGPASMLVSSKVRSDEVRNHLHRLTLDSSSAGWRTSPAASSGAVRRIHGILVKDAASNFDADTKPLGIWTIPPPNIKKPKALRPTVFADPNVAPYAKYQNVSDYAHSLRSVPGTPLSARSTISTSSEDGCSSVSSYSTLPSSISSPDSTRVANIGMTDKLSAFSSASSVGHRSMSFRMSSRA